MKSVTIYEKRNGDIKLKFGNNTAEVNEAIRSLTTQVEGSTMNILQHGDIPTARSLARRILEENREFLVDIWQNKQAEIRSNGILESIHQEVIQQLRPSMDNDEMGEIESGQSFGIYNFAK